MTKRTNLSKQVVDLHKKWLKTKDTSIVIPSVFKFRLYAKEGHDTMQLYDASTKAALEQAKAVSGHSKWNIKFHVRLSAPQILVLAETGKLNHLSVRKDS